MEMGTLSTTTMMIMTMIIYPKGFIICCICWGIRKEAGRNPVTSMRDCNTLSHVVPGLKASCEHYTQLFKLRDFEIPSQDFEIPFFSSSSSHHVDDDCNLATRSSSDRRRCSLCLRIFLIEIRSVVSYIADSLPVPYV
jgi:hypothetical protein